MEEMQNQHEWENEQWEKEFSTTQSWISELESLINQKQKEIDELTSLKLTQQTSNEEIEEMWKNLISLQVKNE